MAAYVILTPHAINYGAGGNYSDTYSYARFPLGLEVQGVDPNLGGGRFIFCQGSNGAAGNFVSIQNQSAVAVASANSASRFPVGVDCGGLTATNVYGWVQVQGRADYCSHTNTGVTAGVPLYLGATTGILFSNVVAGQRVGGVHVPANQTVTATSVSYTFDLQYPSLIGILVGSTNATVSGV